MSKPTIKNASHSAAERTGQARVIPRDETECPNWCTNHSRYGGEPISEAYPGLHQSANFATQDDVEVRITQGMGEPVSVDTYTPYGDINGANARELRDLGKALAKAADALDQIADPRLAFLAERNVTVVELDEDNCRHAIYNPATWTYEICTHLDETKRNAVLDRAVEAVSAREAARAARS